MEAINGSAVIRRSFGVTAVAVLSLLGSLLTLLFGITMALGLLLFPLRATRELSSPQVFRAILVLGTLMYLLPAIWGLASSIGLFRLRNWARISTIVFSVLLILMGAYGGRGR